MPLSESAKKFWFGNIEPQYRLDYSGTGGAIKYEGYATPGTSEDAAGWVILEHTTVNGADTAGKPKYGLVWTLRAIYNYDSP